MNIDLLVKMANEISAFFAGASDAEAAARDVANHLRRFWEPRMREQIIKYYEDRSGAGLSELAKSAVALLRSARQAPPAAPPPPAAKPKGAAT